MNSKIIEAVPNFSTSNKKILAKIIQAIKKNKTIKIIDYSSDKDHNRSVITFIGSSNKIVKAAFDAIKKATELINMSKHSGVHPAIGACDVMPFVPIKNAKMNDCIKIAKKLGTKVAQNLNIPVYLYEYAATTNKRRNLAYIRNRRFETLKNEISNNIDVTPDYGPKKISKAGGICIGARKILIAFNINLKIVGEQLEMDNYLKRVKKIAKIIREKDGGLPCVKAFGFYLKTKDCYQISMNLTDFNKTPPKIVFDKIKKEASKYGFEIRESELIGLIPLNATFEGFAKYLQLKNFNQSKIIENAIKN